MSREPVSFPKPAPPESGARPRGGFVVRFHGASFAIVRRETVIGRGASADIVIEGELISRRHAVLLLLESGGLAVEDLESRNGTRVNGAEVRGRAPLAIGDRLEVGGAELVIAEEASFERPESATNARTLEFDGSSGLESSDDGARLDAAFALLGSLVDKALALGRGVEAERLLARHLAALLVAAEHGGAPNPETCALGAGYALKLATALGRAAWIDYLVRLYTARRAPLPMPLVDELYSLLRKIRGVDVAALRRYVESLRADSDRLGPTERFALQRLDGLVKLAG